MHCVLDKNLLIFASVLFINILDRIFPNTSSSVIGLRCLTGPFSFFGFGNYTWYQLKELSH